ncbi:potassium channel protein [Leucothrix sargassi]|nr:potassium channel protein [Leucothrix sargassi]
MFYFLDTFKHTRVMRVVRENKWLMFFFVIISLLFALYMNRVEGFSALDTYYFLVTTATTVGYGDMSPQTDLGKIFVTVYMVVGIALLGLFLGKVTEVMVDISSRRKKGLIHMKSEVDLIITGYPSDAKVQDIVCELRNDPRFERARIVCLNNCLEEKAPWMTKFDVHFVKGVPSDSTNLAAAGIESAKTVLILANDATAVESDDLSTSVCAVVERLRPEVRTIVEKVRQDKLVFEVVNADTVVDVASASVLAQEILDPGAVELQNAIFSTHTQGTQYNLVYQGEDRTWSEIAMAILKKDAIPEGYQAADAKHFDLLPKQDAVIKSGALIKYRGTELLLDLSF